jgi:hypothetical protein
MSESVRSNSYRLDVPLGNAPLTIDAVVAIDDYRNLIIL